MDFPHHLPRLEVVRRERYIIDKCRGKKVLDLGAVGFYRGWFSGLHRSIMDVTDSVVGIDIDKTGIERAALQGIRNIHYGDLQKLGDVDISDTFDVIIAGGVIEHLPNPGLFLMGVKRFFQPNTEMILETPNVFSLHRFYLALRRIEYVHPEHVCYYSYSTLKHMLEIHGYTVKEELAHVLGGRVTNLRMFLAERNLNFANGFIFVVTT